MDTGGEYLLEGAAGTGKSRAGLEFAHFLCWKYPGIRLLFARQKKDKMAESVLETWEKKVLWPGHPALVPERSRERRTNYHFPNASHIVLLGLHDAQDTFSMEFDGAIVFEAIQTTLDTWEKLARLNRNAMMPFQFRLAETNPGPKAHYLNQRAIQGKIRRLKSTHKDNPFLYDAEKGDWTPRGKDYMAELRSTHGANYSNLYLGEWVSAAGAVWPMYDESVHVTTREYLPEIEYYMGSMDFGWKNPGCLQVWGVDRQKNIYRVAEVYQTEKHMDWWGERIVELYQQYPMRTIVADSAEPRSIDFLNDYLGPRCDRPMARIVRPFIKKTAGAGEGLYGLDVVRWALSMNSVGMPRMRFLADAFPFGKDEVRVARNLPACTEDEIPSYTFIDKDEGVYTPEKPDPNCEDHGCDATRMMAVWHWKNHYQDNSPVLDDEPDEFYSGRDYMGDDDWDDEAA